MLGDARSCSELLRDARSCSELLRAARRCSEMLGAGRGAKELLTVWGNQRGKHITYIHVTSTLTVWSISAVVFFVHQCKYQKNGAPGHLFMCYSLYKAVACTHRVHRSQNLCTRQLRCAHRVQGAPLISNTEVVHGGVRVQGKIHPSYTLFSRLINQQIHQVLFCVYWVRSNHPPGIYLDNCSKQNESAPSFWTLQGLYPVVSRSFIAWCCWEVNFDGIYS